MRTLFAAALFLNTRLVSLPGQVSPAIQAGFVRCEEVWAATVSTFFTKGKVLTEIRNMAQQFSEKEYCKFRRSRVD
jgi:hypothetical protein